MFSLQEIDLGKAIEKWNVRKYTYRSVRDGPSQKGVASVSVW